MLKDKLAELLAERPIPLASILNAMAAAAVEHRGEDFDTIADFTLMHDVGDQVLAYPAMALIPAWGEMGIAHLKQMAVNGPHRAGAVGVLVMIAQGNFPKGRDIMFLPHDWESIATYTVQPNLVSVAQRELRSVILDQLGDELSKGNLLNTIANQVIFSVNAADRNDKLNFLLHLLIDSHLSLNENVINQFESLLNAGPEKEEELHKFLLAYPALLDPYITELRSKHELGDDYITDFVIRRLNNEYILVEIENSTDRLFRQDGSFTSDLMKAIAQVRDFQAWVSDHIAYAQAKLPGIRHPDGLVVLGRREGLTPDFSRRLDEENFSRRGHIKIVTYDDLLDQAKVVYRNMLEKPVVRTKGT